MICIEIHFESLHYCTVGEILQRSVTTSGLWYRLWVSAHDDHDDDDDDAHDDDDDDDDDDDGEANSFYSDGEADGYYSEWVCREPLQRIVKVKTKI